jgi:hypothetical protein
MKNILVGMVLIGLYYAQAPKVLRAPQVPEGPGRITGAVLTQEGQPIANANVCISAADTNSSLCYWLTDQAGQFEIPQLPLGSFVVAATKEEDGYARWNNGPGQKAVLTLQEPNANLAIKLGAKAGTLIGLVRDSVTGKPVDNIRVLYMPITDERTGSGSAAGYQHGEFMLNLPTTSDFLVFVTAPGYKTWFYNDANGPSLQLASGEQKTIDVALEPRPAKGVKQ